MMSILQRISVDDLLTKKLSKDQHFSNWHNRLVKMGTSLSDMVILRFCFIQKLQSVGSIQVAVQPQCKHGPLISYS